MISDSEGRAKSLDLRVVSEASYAIDSVVSPRNESVKLPEVALHVIVCTSLL